MTSVRPRRSAGRKRPVFSARYCRIAPDSNTLRGAPPSAGSWSTIAGILLLGEIARNAGSNCSPAEMFTGRTVYGNPVSSRNIVILCPFGVVQ